MAAGGFGQPAAGGTEHFKYSPLVGTDVVLKDGARTGQTIYIKHHCITCMKEYEDKSLEELRLEDYAAGRKRLAQGLSQPDYKSLFGASTGGFGQPAAGGTEHFKYSPLVGTDVVLKHGARTGLTINIKHHCITCMKVCIRIVEISNSWGFLISFGFTNHDPATLAHSLPNFSCSDLTNKPGNWAKALGKCFCEKDNVLYYYVNSAGDVHFGVNGVEKGLLFSGVDIWIPLWALVDIYGNGTAVQFADPRAPNQPIQSSQLCLSSLPSCSLPQPGPRPPLPRGKAPRDQCTASQNSINEQVLIPNNLRPSTSRQTQPIYSVIGENLTETECTICYENPIDSVLYMCGHMCMCYRCAVKQWRRKDGGQCPICRAQIKDVIRTYKS